LKWSRDKPELYVILAHMKQLFAITLVTVLSAPAFAGPPIGSGSCQCKAQNKMYDQGQTVCLKMPQGMQLVQCIRDLNVTSWKKIQDGCPNA
jgi:hypothetical protein